MGKWDAGREGEETNENWRCGWSGCSFVRLLSGSKLQSRFANATLPWQNFVRFCKFSLLDLIIPASLVKEISCSLFVATNPIVLEALKDGRKNTFLAQYDPFQKISVLSVGPGRIIGKLKRSSPSEPLSHGETAQCLECEDFGLLFYYKVESEWSLISSNQDSSTYIARLRTTLVPFIEAYQGGRAVFQQEYSLADHSAYTEVQGFFEQTATFLHTEKPVNRLNELCLYDTVGNLVRFSGSNVNRPQILLWSRLSVCLIGSLKHRMT